MVKIIPQVSSKGRYKNCHGVISTPSPTKSGYVDVQIAKKNHKIHRLIAIAFRLPQSRGQIEVDHIDGNPSNNRLENLRWVTRSKNIFNSYATNKHRKSSAGKRSKKIEGRKIGTQEWREFESVSKASRTLNLFQGSISSCCNNKRNRAGEYEFRFANQQTEPKLLPGEEWRDVIMC
jgi:hypothetical protein